MIDKQSEFYKLGMALATPDNVELPENDIYNAKHIELQRKFASALAAFMNLTPEVKNTPAHMHLCKIATTKDEDWNDSCEDTLLKCLEVIERDQISPEQFGKFASAAEIAVRAGITPALLAVRMAGLGIPLVGALGGGVSWLAEKEISEDDYKTEKLKAQMEEYRRMSRNIEKELREYYGYKTPEELEEEKAIRDNMEALAEKENSEQPSSE